MSKRTAAYLGDQPYIFISYSHKDSPIIYPMIDWLNGQGYRVWYDEGIQTGKSFTSDIAESINNCSQFIIFISNNSINSFYVKKEIEYAAKREKNILPIYLDDNSLDSHLDFVVGSVQGIMKYELLEDDFYKAFYKALSKKCSSQSQVEDLETIVPQKVKVKKTLTQYKRPLILGLILLVLLSGVSFLNKMNALNSSLDVPEENNLLVNNSVSYVGESIEAIDPSIDYEVVGYEYSDTYKEDEIISQSIKGLEGQEYLEIILSKGPEKIYISSYFGMSIDDVKTILDSKDISYKINYREVSAGKDNIILDQSDFDTTIDKSSEVVFTVTQLKNANKDSSAVKETSETSQIASEETVVASVKTTDTIYVPDYQGQLMSAVKQDIESRGFKYKIQTDQTNDYSEGTITYQDLRKESVESSEIVTFVVAEALSERTSQPMLSEESSDDTKHILDDGIYGVLTGNAFETYITRDQLPEHIQCFNKFSVVGANNASIDKLITLEADDGGNAVNPSSETIKYSSDATYFNNFAVILKKNSLILGVYLYNGGLTERYVIDSSEVESIATETSPDASEVTDNNSDDYHHIFSEAVESIKGIDEFKTTVIRSQLPSHIQDYNGFAVTGVNYASLQEVVKRNSNTEGEFVDPRIEKLEYFSDDSYFHNYAVSLWRDKKLYAVYLYNDGMIEKWIVEK